MAPDGERTAARAMRIEIGNDGPLTRWGRAVEWNLVRSEVGVVGILVRPPGSGHTGRFRGLIDADRHRGGSWHGWRRCPGPSPGSWCRATSPPPWSSSPPSSLFAPSPSPPNSAGPAVPASSTKPRSWGQECAMTLCSITCRCACHWFPACLTPRGRSTPYSSTPRFPVAARSRSESRSTFFLPLLSGRVSSGLVIAQLNPNMPYTFGDAELSVDWIDLAIEVDEPLSSVPSRQIIETGRNIGELSLALPMTAPHCSSVSGRSLMSSQVSSSPVVISVSGPK